MGINGLVRLLTSGDGGFGLMSLMHAQSFWGLRAMVPVVKDLHRFFIAISRAVVNADDSPGIAPDPLV